MHSAPENVAFLENVCHIVSRHPEWLTADLMGQGGHHRKVPLGFANLAGGMIAALDKGKAACRDSFARCRDLLSRPSGSFAM